MNVECRVLNQDLFEKIFQLNIHGSQLIIKTADAAS